MYYIVLCHALRSSHPPRGCSRKVRAEVQPDLKRVAALECMAQYAVRVLYFYMYLKVDREKHTVQ